MSGKSMRVKVLATFLSFALIASSLSLTAFAEGAADVTTESNDVVEVHSVQDEVTISVDAQNASLVIEGQQVLVGNTLNFPISRDLVFEVAADAGFEIASVKAKEDGSNAEIALSQNNGSYTISQIDLSGNEGVTVVVETTEVEAPTVEDPSFEAFEPEETEELEAVVEETAADQTPMLLGAETRSSDIVDFLDVDENGIITKFHYSSGISPTDIVIPEKKGSTTIVGIGHYVFSGCQLTSVVLPDTITSIGMYAFQNNKELTSVKLPSGLTEIRGYTFDGCTALSSIDLPNSLTKIEHRVFQGCTSLGTVVLPESMESLGEGAFASCTSLASINWPKNMHSLDNYVFANSGLTEVTIGEGVATIPYGAFMLCSELATVNLPDSLNVIERSAFQSCSKLNDVVIPKNVTSIEENAFLQINSDSFIRLSHFLPNAIPGQPWGHYQSKILWKEIEESCYWFDADTQQIVGMKPAGHDNCQHTDYHEPGANITIPSSIKVAGITEPVTVKGIVPEAFAVNLNLKSVTFDPSCQIERIQESTFRLCFQLEKLVMSNSIKYIDEEAFYMGYALSSVTFSNALEVIGVSAFAASNLSQGVDLPDSLQKINRRAFADSQLPSIKIPASVVSIGEAAFNTKTLKTATILGSNGSLNIHTSAFYPDDDGITDVYVEGHVKDSIPDAAWGAQYGTIHWANNEKYGPEIIETKDANGNPVFHFNTRTNTWFKYVGEENSDVEVTIPYTFEHEGKEYTAGPFPESLLAGKTLGKLIIEEGYESIPAYFMKDGKLKELILPDTINSIGHRAFMNSGIEELTLPKSNCAFPDFDQFAGCNLTSLVIPEGMTSIGSGTFANNPNLTSVEFPSTFTGTGGGTGVFENCNLTGKIELPASVTDLSPVLFANNPNITEVYVDLYRKDASYDVLNALPWGAPAGALIVFKGEEPEPKHTITQTTKDDGRARIIDVEAVIPAETPLFTGVWVSVDGGPLVDIFSTDMQSWDIDISFTAVENGTYTFYFKTAFIQSNDPADFYTYDVVVDDIGVNTTTAKDVELSIANKGSFTAAQILAANASAPELTDNDSKDKGGTDANGFAFSISDADMAKINALTTIGQSEQIVIQGSYKNAHDFKGDTYTYNLSDAYNTDSSDGKNHLKSDETYAYTNTSSTTITVTLMGYEVGFDLKGGSAPEGVVESTEYAKQYLGDGEKVAAVAEPVREGYTFEGWQVKGATTKWDFNTSTVSGDMTLEAQWKKASYAYVVKYYYDGVEDESVRVSDTAEFESTITYTDKEKIGYKFDSVTGSPLTISTTVANNLIEVFYVKDSTQTQPTEYTVEYYRDGVKVDEDSYTKKATAWINDDPAMIDIQGTIDAANDKYVGYKLGTTDPAVLPTVGDTVKSGTTIKVNYVKDDTQVQPTEYTVEYYRDGVKVAADSYTKTATAWINDDPATIAIQEEIDAANKKYVGYKLASTEPASLPKKDEKVLSGAVIKVNYVKDDADVQPTSYTVEYYRDGEKVLVDCYTENGTAWINDSPAMIAVKNEIDTATDKYVGYKLDNTSPSSLPKKGEKIKSGTTIKVNYIKDETQTQPTSYTVEYYRDGVRVDEDSYTENDTVWINDDPVMIAIKNNIDAANDKYEGYKIDATDPVALPNAGDKVMSGTVIKINYVKDGFLLTFDSQGADQAATVDSLSLTVEFDAVIEATSGFPTGLTKPGHALRGWKMPDGSWVTSSTKMPAQDTKLAAVWERGTVIVIDKITIVASDFVMSMLEAQSHQAKSPSGQFKELVERGLAKAWWTDTKEDVDIIGIKVVPSAGNGKSIDAVPGDYYVTYYAGMGADEVSATVLATVFGNTSAKGTIAGNDFTYNIAGGALTEDDVRSRGQVTVYDTWGAKTQEAGRILEADLVRLNQMIADGVTGDVAVTFFNAEGDSCIIIVTLVRDPETPVPVTPIAPTTPTTPDPLPVPEPVAEVIAPIATTMEAAARSVAGPAAIDDDGTPLASGQWCWVHFYIILGMMLTGAYSVLVIARRRSHTKYLRGFEQKLYGKDDRGVRHDIRTPALGNI